MIKTRFSFLFWRCAKHSFFSFVSIPGMNNFRSLLLHHSEAHSGGLCDDTRKQNYKFKTRHNSEQNEVCSQHYSSASFSIFFSRCFSGWKFVTQWRKKWHFLFKNVMLMRMKNFSLIFNQKHSHKNRDPVSGFEFLIESKPKTRLEVEVQGWGKNRLMKSQVNIHLLLPWYTYKN